MDLGRDAPVERVTEGVDKPGRAGVRIARGLASLRADVSFAAVDALLVIVAYSGALMLRFVDLPEGVPPRWWQDFVLFLPVIVAAHLVTNVLFGAYGHVWQFASIAEAVKIVLASACAAVVLLTGMMAYRALSGGLGPIPIGSTSASPPR